MVDKNLVNSDYSGDFDPDFSHDRLARSTLIKLQKTYSEYVRRIDGYWYTAVMNRWGNEQAVDANIKVWRKAILFELKAITRALHIEGHDVISLMKYIQSSAWMNLSEYEIDIKSNTHVILTHITCPTLFAIEKEGTGREVRQCGEVGAEIFGMMAGFFNPDIKVTPLKLPPRSSQEEVCCSWEFKLEVNPPLSYEQSY